MQTKSEILQVLFQTKAQFRSVTYVKPLKTRKGVTQVITKKIRMSVRAGLDYDNMKTVQEKRETGELPAQNAGLQWGEWKNFPYLIEHKGKEYIRLYPNYNGKTETTYFVDGQPAQLEEFQTLVLASELPKTDGNKPDCISVSFDNVQTLV